MNNISKFQFVSASLLILVVGFGFYSLYTDNHESANNSMTIASIGLGILYLRKAYKCYQLEDRKNGIFNIVIGSIWCLLGVCRICFI